jgi:hypothetical protein
MAAKTVIRPGRAFVPNGPKTKRLYMLEEARSEAIAKAAREYARVMGHDERDYWVRTMPQALFDLLDSFDVDAAHAAAEAFLDYQRRRFPGRWPVEPAKPAGDFDPTADGPTIADTREPK